jgi:hypothetical protein
MSGVALAGCGQDTMMTMMAPRGSVEVTTVTSGSAIDPDGYTVRIAGGTRDELQSIGTNATITVSNLDAGTYVLSLEDVAANCTVANNDRTITVAVDATTRETFNVQC